MNATRLQAVVVGPEGPALRRAVGPTPWAVLETAFAVAAASGDALVAEVSVRQLAETLGLARDTVARALLVLRRADLLTLAQSRTCDGTFAFGRYSIDVPPDALALITAPRNTAPTRHTRRLSSVPVEQLTLLPK